MGNQGQEARRGGLVRETRARKAEGKSGEEGGDRVFVTPLLLPCKAK